MIREKDMPSRAVISLYESTMASSANCKLVKRMLNFAYVLDTSVSSYRNIWRSKSLLKP